MTEAVADLQQEEFPLLDYIQYYGLNEDPFDEESAFFFTGAGRQDLLEHLLHHCQFGTSLLVVLGDLGSGKTTLCSVLAGQLRGPEASELADQQVCCIDAECSPSTGQIMTELSKAFAQAASRPEADQHESQLQASLAIEPHRVLLIDNAQQLEESALETLAYLAGNHDGGEEQWHIVLFGAPTMAERVTEEQLQEVLVHHLYLPLLSADEVRDYLDARLEAVGYNEKLASPFDEVTLGKLWAESRGNIAALNDLARQWLIESVGQSEKARSRGLPLGHMLAVVLLVSILLLAFLYRDGDTEVERVSESVALPAAVQVPEANSERLSAKPEVPVESLAENYTIQESDGIEPEASPSALGSATYPDKKIGDKLPKPPIAEERVEPAPLATAQNLESTSETAQNPAISARGRVDEQMRSSTDSEETDARSLNASQSGDVTHKKQTLAKGAAEEAPVRSREASLSEDEQRLLSISADYYTLQVLSAASKEGVERFVRDQENSQSLRIYATRRHGRNWYVVVAGEYPSSQAARTSITQLPVSQQNAGPWPRKLAEIQKEIQSFRGF